MQWIDPADWASLLQFQLFPAVKDALHSLMSAQSIFFPDFSHPDMWWQSRGDASFRTRRLSNRLSRLVSTFPQMNSF